MLSGILLGQRKAKLWVIPCVLQGWRVAGWEGRRNLQPSLDLAGRLRVFHQDMLHQQFYTGWAQNTKSELEVASRGIELGDPSWHRWD